MSAFDFYSYVCTCGHWRADHAVQADEDQPAHKGPCRITGRECQFPVHDGDEPRKGRR